jgi:hypothetical protein
MPFGQLLADELSNSELHLKVEAKIPRMLPDARPESGSATVGRREPRADGVVKRKSPRSSVDRAAGIHP